MIKSSTRVNGIKPEILLAYIIAKPILEANGQVAVITSCTDGRHSSGSRHYSGESIDVRTRDLTDDVKQKVADQIADALGDEYYVLLETSHLHISFKGLPG